MQRDNISYLSLFEFRFGLTGIVKKESNTGLDYLSQQYLMELLNLQLAVPDLQT
jgi:hypothetical protein